MHLKHGGDGPGQSIREFLETEGTPGHQRLRLLRCVKQMTRMLQSQTGLRSPGLQVAGGDLHVGPDVLCSVFLGLVAMLPASFAWARCQRPRRPRAHWHDQMQPEIMARVYPQACCDGGTPRQDSLLSVTRRNAALALNGLVLTSPIDIVNDKDAGRR